MNPRRAALAMLVVAGVPIGHGLGYAVAHPSAAAREVALGGHAYLPATAAIVVPLGVLAALAWAIRTSRDLGLAGTIRWSQLAGLQAAAFAVQEVVERELSGRSGADAVGERGVWIGLLAQVAVAYLAVRAIDAVRRVVRAIRPGRRLLGQRIDVALPTWSSRLCPPLVRTVAVGVRGPPIVPATR